MILYYDEKFIGQVCQGMLVRQPAVTLVAPFLAQEFQIK